MARPKKYDNPIVNPPKERVRQLAAAIERIDGEIAEMRKDRSEYLKSAKEAQIKTDVLTSCVKLAKMEGGARHLWLNCFDQMRLDLGLDNMASAMQAQTDLEDAVRHVEIRDEDGTVLFEAGEKAGNGGAKAKSKAKLMSPYRVAQAIAMLRPAPESAAEPE